MAEVQYRIRGKDESQAAVKSAVGGLDKMSNAAQKMGKVFKVAFSAVIIKKAFDAIKDVTKAYGEQEQVEIKLAAAARNNPLINGDAVKGLKEYAASLQRSTTFGDEAIIQQEAFLVTLGLTENQIRDVMRAAVDLASTGMVSLESAVKNISKTYGGMTGELGELIPALKNLTVEELKAGDAVKFIKDQYAGMGEAVAQSVEGQVAQLKNSFGDLKEAFGKTITNLAGNFNSVLGPVLEGFTKWIQDNQLQIVNFFRNFPEIASTSLNAVWEGIKQTFAPDNLKLLAGALWEYFISYAKAAVNFIYNYLKAWGTTIWEPLKFGFEWIIYGIRSLWATVMNFFIDGLNKVGKIAHDIGQKILHPINAGNRAEWGGGIGGVAGPGATPIWGDSGVKIIDAWKDAGLSVVDLIKQQFTGLKGVGEALWKPFKNAWKEYIPQFKRILQEPGPLLSDAADSMSTSSTALATAADDIKASTLDFQTMVSDYTSTFADAMASGGIGGPDAYSGGGSGGGAVSAVIEMFAQMVPVLGDFLMAVTPVAAILAMFAPVIASVLDFITPLVNEILKPFIGHMVIIGQVIGKLLVPVLKMLAPVVEWLTQNMVAFYNNAIVPIGNFFYKLIVIITTLIAAIAAGIANVGIAIYNLVHRKAKDKEYIKVPKVPSWSSIDSPFSAIDTADIYAASDQYDTGGSGGAGASYTSGRNVTVNVQINTDVIVGDRREMAIWIAEEIHSAEELGLI